MRRMITVSACILYGAVVCLNVGCSGSNSAPDTAQHVSDRHEDELHDPEGHQDHDHDHSHSHAAPETLEEAVESIDHLADQIKTSLKADDEDAAHGPLHDVDSVLNSTGLLLAKSELSDEQKKAAGESIKKLKELYGKIDAKMHGEEGIDYADVSKEIDAELESLHTATGVEHDHDHDK